MNNIIRAFLFDLGDIFFEAHCWRKWMYEFFSKEGYFTGNFAEFYFLYEKFLKQVYEGKEEYEKAFYKFLEHISIPKNKIDKIVKLSFGKKKFYEDNRKLYKSVKHTLTKLNQAKIKNIVITDNEATESEIRKNILKRFGINHVIYGVVTSKEVGVTKPDHKIFEYALNKYSLKKEQVYFVAHDFDEILGAQRIGIKVIEFNNYLGIKTPAEFHIDNFFQLLDFI